MQYLIIHIDFNTGKPSSFYSDRYDYENNYEAGMIIVNNSSNKITFDGETWEDIEYDHL